MLPSSLSAPKAGFQRFIAEQTERCRRITAGVAERVPGAKIKDEDWAWRITVYGRGSCLLRRDTQWISLSTSAGTSFVDDMPQPLPEDIMIEKLVTLIQAFPHQVPAVTPSLIPVIPPSLIPVLPPSLIPVTPPSLIPLIPLTHPMSDSTPTPAPNPPDIVFDASVRTPDEQEAMMPPLAPKTKRILPAHWSTKGRTPDMKRPVSGGVRKSEVARLKAEGRIFENYKI